MMKLKVIFLNLIVSVVCTQTFAATPRSLDCEATYRTRGASGNGNIQIVSSFSVPFETSDDGFSLAHKNMSMEIEGRNFQIDANASTRIKGGAVDVALATYDNTSGTLADVDGNLMRGPRDSLRLSLVLPSVGEKIGIGFKLECGILWNSLK